MTRIALVQQHATADRDDNLERGLAALADAAQRGAELVAFAELALEPFHPQRRARGDVRGLAEPVPGRTTEAFAVAARRHGVVVVLNLYERAADARPGSRSRSRFRSRLYELARASTSHGVERCRSPTHS